MLTILLTSYNRPQFLQRAVESILAQEDDRWRLIVLDDNSDDPDVLDYLGGLNDERIEIRLHSTTAEERQEAARYSVLINTVLPDLDEGIVGYLCDNVEYDRELVGTVLDWFEANPDNFSGYVTQLRDVYVNGVLAGGAGSFGHWPVLPSHPGEPAQPGRVFGNLDHSQVFHRLPIDMRWNESFDVVKLGDGEFFDRLSLEHGPIECISDNPLTWEHLLK